jgi:hypothetical protein
MNYRPSTEFFCGVSSEMKIRRKAKAQIRTVTLKKHEASNSGTAASEASHEGIHEDTHDAAVK